MNSKRRTLYLEESKRAEMIGSYVVRTGSTVRAAASKFKVSKSSVHHDLTKKLLYVNPLLSKEVRRVLDYNKSERHIRGGIATKLKFEKEKALNKV